MATFRIALVLVCLMAVGATMTCPDGADSETCSQLDAASLIQLPATATIITGLAQGGATITCTQCMDLLKACIASLSSSSTADQSVGAGMDGPANPCADFAVALQGENGGNYKSVLCIMGNSECGNGDDVLNGPMECYYQLMAKAMPDFDMLCGSGSDSDASGDDTSIPGSSDMDWDMAPPAFTQQEATRKLKGDVSRACTNPNKDDPATWVCPCLSNMRNACTGADDEQACFKCLMCGDSRICADWKTNNCEGTASDCNALLVETNTSTDARAKEARVKEETPSQALDESLSGKRC